MRFRTTFKSGTNQIPNKFLLITLMQQAQTKTQKCISSFRCTYIFHNKRETHALDHMLIIRASDLRSRTVMFIMKKLWDLTFFQGGDVGYILYNDQPPQQQKLFGDATRSCGHTKGAAIVQLTAWNDMNGTQAIIYGGWSVNVNSFSLFQELLSLINNRASGWSTARLISPLLNHRDSFHTPVLA